MKTIRQLHSPQKAPIEQPEAPTLSDTCRYCDRVQWGNIRYLGLGQWAHAECTPGSTPWREWYEIQPVSKRTSAMDILYLTAK